MPTDQADASLREALRELHDIGERGVAAFERLAEDIRRLSEEEDRD